MGASSLLDIGKTALFANQTQLNVTGNNIAKANIPGYSRQDVILEIATPANQGVGFIGRGVTVSGIKRQYDSLVQNQITSAQQDYGKSSTLSQTLSNIEQIFNETQDLGLATPMTDFFNAWQGVASNPQGLTERNLLLQKSNVLVNSAKNMEQEIENILKFTQTGIADLTGKVNALATRIANLNGQIIQVEAGTNLPIANDLRDQRDQALKDLGNLIESSSWEDKSDGSLSVSVGQKALVSGTTTQTLSAVYDKNADYTLQLAGDDITSRITKGEMGGLLTARQDMKDHLLDLRKLVASLTNTVNLQHAQGFGLDNTTGANFFNALQLSVTKDSAAATLAATVTNLPPLTLDEYSVAFIASVAPSGFDYQITNSTTGLVTSGAYVVAGTTVNLDGIKFVISGAVTAQDSFTVSPLTTAIQNFATAIADPRKLGASSTLADLPGNNTNALVLANLINTQVTALGTDTFSGYYQNLVSQIASQTKSASDELNFNDAFLAELTNRRDSISGVNMDEEASNLVRFQRAYEAAARLIKVADELLQTLLQL